MNKTARHKITSDINGQYRLQFFCDLSGALEYTSKPVSKSNPEKDLEKVWAKEAKLYFNPCVKCGKWVSDVMYNADVLECVACSPWEDAPKYCPHCGKSVEGSENKCKNCKKPLRYEGGESK